RELVDRQKIGKLIAVRAHAGSYFLYRSPFHPWMDYRQDYAAKKIGGGVILDSATHHIDYITSLLGEGKEVFCYAGRMGSLGLEAEDIAEILLKFETGAVANVHVNFVQQPYQNKYEIIGEKGTIAWNITDNTVKLFSDTDNKWQTFPPESNFDPNETYIQEIVQFLGCISGRGQPPVDGVMGKKILEIALAAKKSAQTGKAITPKTIVR
ncbi:Gfo/Idh/MocA family oxidoreductase, partial [bacterium]|nr:Gfo/Idh/MocA family oxidoreductase [bacterium]